MTSSASDEGAVARQASSMSRDDVASRDVYIAVMQDQASREDLALAYHGSKRSTTALWTSIPRAVSTSQSLRRAARRARTSASASLLFDGGSSESGNPPRVRLRVLGHGVELPCLQRDRIALAGQADDVPPSQRRPTGGST